MVTKILISNLVLWEIYAASAALATLSQWGRNHSGPVRDGAREDIAIAGN
jgi:hypothetical protein